MFKEKLITAITFIVLLGAFALGIFFIVRLVNGPNSQKKTDEAILSGELKTYTHPDYGFTFNYPANFKLGKFPEGDGEVILVQREDPSTGSGQAAQGFQIFVSLYEDENPLSKAIIQESAPDMKINNNQEIEVGFTPSEVEGEDKIKALSFDASTTLGAGTDSTHEIWFVQDGNLYQVTSYKDFGEEMEEIIKTIRFN